MSTSLSLSSMLAGLMILTAGGGAFAAAPAKPLSPDDIFAPYVSKVPKVVTVVSESTADGVKVTRLRFASTEGNAQGTTNASEIYAILARPAAAAKAKRPAILFCHGGAGFANEAGAVGWAKLGYVCIAPDLVGYADQKKVLSVSRVTKGKYCEFVTTVKPTRYSCAMFDGGVAGLGAFNLLASQEDVDAKRIGITGGSCGGYMVTLLSGLLDGRIKAVFNLYGSGFVQQGSVFDVDVCNLPPADFKTWFDNFDASVRLGRSRATYLLYAAINDHFFSNRSVISTFDAYAGPKYMCWAPNSNHCILLPGGTTEKAAPLFTEMEPAYFACVLNGGKLPELTASLGAAGSKTLKFTVKNCPKDAEGWFYYAAPFDPQPKHEQLKWEKIAATAGAGGTFTCTVPASPENFDWFGGIHWKLKAGEVERPISLTTALILHAKGKADAAVK